VLPARHFALSASNSLSAAQFQRNQARLTQKRFFQSSSACASVTQQAPNPKAYLESGAVKPSVGVDVKKVLVIGSGGLAIGQAGEFDYSGTFLISCAMRPLQENGPMSHLGRISKDFLG
jgi:carbamoyl-phosphate synthase large subunit